MWLQLASIRAEGPEHVLPSAEGVVPGIQRKAEALHKRWASDTEQSAALNKRGALEELRWGSIAHILDGIPSTVSECRLLLVRDVSN
eukprot:4504093-Amphidinium_carterae.1